MRVSTLFSLAITCLPIAFSQATLYPRAATCYATDPTRSHPDCDCLPGFDNPASIQKQCRCPDEENTRLVITTETKKKVTTEVASCECIGGAQTFSITEMRCICESGYIGTYNKKGVLTCKLPKHETTETSSKHHKTHTKSKHSSTSTSTVASSTTWTTSTPTPTGSWDKRSKRALHEAIAQRGSQEDSALDAVSAVLGCGIGEKACEVEGSWTCTDITSSLATCGGCAGEATDCGSLPGVDAVHCAARRCVINSCRRGFTFESTEVPLNSTAPDAVCIAKTKSTWFQVQGGSDL